MPDVPAPAHIVLSGHTRRRVHDRSAVLRVLVAALAAAMLATSLAAIQAPPVAAGGSCTGWQSLTVPPTSIRVRVGRNRVHQVDFKRYVAIVMGHEWGGYLPQATLDAAAIAVKQYAWYHALAGHHRGHYVTASGKCYDVSDTTADQIFKPAGAHVSPKHWQAIDKTWNISLRKNGHFLMTGYRTGNRGVHCGRDADGWHMKARSAIDCARRGLSGLQILRRYYSPNLELVVAHGRETSAERQAAVAAAIDAVAWVFAGVPPNAALAYGADLLWLSALQRASAADAVWQERLDAGSGQQVLNEGSLIPID